MSGNPLLTRLNLADIFLPENVIIGLAQKPKLEVIKDLIGRLVENRKIPQESELAIGQLVLGREKIGSTALGNGIAFPHCRSDVINDFVGAVAVDSRGVDFDALDKSLVQVVFLLIGPFSNREHYFDLLGRINSIGSHKAIRLLLASCKSPDAVTRLLRKLDAENEFK